MYPAKESHSETSGDNQPFRQAYVCFAGVSRVILATLLITWTDFPASVGLFLPMLDVCDYTDFRHL